MCERETDIYEYYTNLEYNEIDKKMVIEKIFNLNMNITNKDFPTIFTELATLIKKFLPLFQSVYEHVDVATTIIEYLDYFVLELHRIKHDDLSKAEKAEKVTSILYTFHCICAELEEDMELFLREPILYDSTLEERPLRTMLQDIPHPSHEMIVLADSDLYAVINYLKMTKSSYFDTIWIQLPIKKRFLLLIKEHCKHSEFPIRIFRSKQELLTLLISNKTSIMSIWSEDIITAKDLATSVNRSVVFINSHMDLYGGIVLFHYTGKLYKYLKLDQDVRICKSSTSHNYLAKNLYKMVYNFFYDGMWQKPVKDTYWEYNDKLWANATSEDIKKCMSSAQKGYETWSAWSTNSRMKVLSTFAHVLQCNGKFELADIVLKYMKFPHYYENSLLCPQSGRLEITTIREPHGIIFLNAGEEEELFNQLTQALMSGNSVIVICDETLGYTLAPYCDMFSTSHIPPGVINMLSCKNIDDILDASLFHDYEEQFKKDEPGKIYTNLTMSKKIIHPLK